MSTPETDSKQQAHREASAAASELLMDAVHADCFITAWIDDQGVFHWRSGGSSTTARGMIENLRDLARDNFLNDDEDDDGSEPA